MSCHFKPWRWRVVRICVQRRGERHGRLRRCRARRPCTETGVRRSTGQAPPARHPGRGSGARRSQTRLRGLQFDEAVVGAESGAPYDREVVGTERTVVVESKLPVVGANEPPVQFDAIISFEVFWAGSGDWVPRDPKFEYIILPRLVSMRQSNIRKKWKSGVSECPKHAEVGPPRYSPPDAAI